MTTPILTYTTGSREAYAATELAEQLREIINAMPEPSRRASYQLVVIEDSAGTEDRIFMLVIIVATICGSFISATAQCYGGPQAAASTWTRPQEKTPGWERIPAWGEEYDGQALDLITAVAPWLNVERSNS